MRLAASRDTADLSGLKAAVDCALRTRRFLDWRESSGWAVAAPVVDELREWAAGRPSRKLAKLAERAVGHLVKVILHADDSNGGIGDLAQELLEVHAVGYLRHGGNAARSTCGSSVDRQGACRLFHLEADDVYAHRPSHPRRWPYGSCLRLSSTLVDPVWVAH